MHSPNLSPAHGSDRSMSVHPDKSVGRQAPGMTRLFVFTHPLPSTVVLMIVLAAAALIFE